MIPFGRAAAASAFTSGTTSGTCGSILHAEELSTTVAPSSAARGAHSSERDPPAENSATSTPSNEPGFGASTVYVRPPHSSRVPALRSEASRVS
jgi:hypothetical protein